MEWCLWLVADDSEVHPDVPLRISENLKGQSRTEGGYVVDPPKLVVEVGDSSRFRDLGPKKAAYEKAGVLEYLFVGLDPKEICWFVRRDGLFQERSPGDDGTFRSEVFPGLWLDSQALFSEDLNSLMAALDRGLATPEPAQFFADLATRQV